MKVIKKTQLYSILIVIGILGIWQLLVMILKIPSMTLPPPTKIIASVLAQRNVLFQNALSSYIAVLEGFVLGGIVGVALAILLMSFEVLNRSLMPILVFFQTMPKVAIAPLIMVWFGLGSISKLILAATIVFFTVMVNTMDGLKIGPEYYDLARVYKANNWQLMRKIRIPNSLPNMFTGLRIGTTLAVIGVTVAEFVGSQEGLGHLMVIYQAYLNISLMFGAIVLLSIFGYVFYEVLKMVEKRYIPWHRVE